MAALTFSVDEDSGAVHAYWGAEEGLPALDVDAIKLALSNCGLGSCALDEIAIADFVVACGTSGAPQTSMIGTRRDAQFSLIISDDLMTVWLTLIPAQGGASAEVEQGLRNKNIVFGIDHELLNDALARGQCENLVIARGEPAQEGTAGWFENIFHENPELALQENDLATIKFSDLSHILLVHRGDKLMHCVPPLQGKSGTDVQGQLVLAKPVPKLTFADNLLGAELDEADPTFLIAAWAGQPVAVDSGAIVNPVIEVQNVDLTTGNIVFEGTISVSGDIKAGMSINVTGDIIVQGTIESAQIIAGGNVSVKGGMIGNADAKSGGVIAGSSNAKVICGGTFQALFAENVHVEAGDAIQIERDARQCVLLARNQIIVGKGNATLGHIVGGSAQAAHLIKAGIFGSSSGTKTSLQVGVDPHLVRDISIKEQRRQRKLAELERILQLIAFFEQNPKKAASDLREKAENTRHQLVDEIGTIDAQLTTLSEQLKLVDRAQVIVGKAIHDGVEFKIGKHVWQVLDEVGCGTIRLTDGKLGIG